MKVLIIFKSLATSWLLNNLGYLKLNKKIITKGPLSIKPKKAT